MKPSIIIAISLFTVSLSCQTSKPSLEYCAAIEDPAERFACYDAMAGRWSADSVKAGGTAPGVVEPAAPGAEVVVQAAPTAPAAAPAVPAVEPEPNAEAAFGLENKQKPEEDRPDKLKLKWTWKKKDAYGKWIIALDNGQVWRQTDTRSFIFKNSEHWVIVSRGFGGGFFLGEPDSHLRIRVKRAE